MQKRTVLGLVIATLVLSLFSFARPAPAQQLQAAKPKIVDLEWPGTLFTSQGIQSYILNTASFKKSGALEERVILLLNAELYGKLRKEITQFIQDLFDEGIDVWAFRIDHTQFLGLQKRWDERAGAKLKGFVADAYFKAEMDKINSRSKRGLIILGAFPTVFINWHQEKIVQGLPLWTDPKATNDYSNAVINVTWNPPSGGKKSITMSSGDMIMTPGLKTGTSSANNSKFKAIKINTTIGPIGADKKAFNLMSRPFIRT